MKERSLQDSALDAVQEEDSMLRPPYPDLKVISLDLFVSLSGGEKVNVEMQTVRHPKFIERMLYYWAGAYTKHLKRGDLYSVLKPVYSLVFADFSLFPQAKRSVTSFSVRSDDPPFFPLTHDLCMVFTDLTKNRPDLKKTVDNRGLWRYFLKESREMDSKDLKLLASKNEEMRMAVEQFKRISEEEKVRGQELLREKAVRDYISWHHYFRTRRDKVLEEGRKEGVQQGRKEGRKEGMQQGVQKGMQQGRKEGMQEGVQTGLQKGLQKGRKEGVQEGMQKGRKEIALNMLKSKMDVARIAQMTGLSEEEIQELQSK